MVKGIYKMREKVPLMFISSRDVRSMTMSFQISNDTLEKYTGNENEVIVPENANSTFDNAFMTGEQSYKYYNEFMWKGRYAECVSVEETIEKMRG